MTQISPMVRISAGLVLVTCSILMGLDLLGFTPTLADAELRSRMQLCETLAAQAAVGAQRNDMASIRAAIQVAVRRNEEVLSAGVRSAEGRLLVGTNKHREIWNPDPDERIPSTHVEVPIFKDGERWSTIEVRFARLGSGEALAAISERPLLRLMGLVAVTGFFAYMLYMRKTLRHLDPSAVIPPRVQAALDVMSEGVILLDEKGRIVLVNASFATQVRRNEAALLGLDASELDWRVSSSGERLLRAPWSETLTEARACLSTPLHLDTGEEFRSFMVKASPVLDGSGKPKGAIATFDDITELEKKSSELEQALVKLEKSQDEISLQNEELLLLAQCDPLTGLSNRRFFLETFGARFETAQRERKNLCCVMADIDHFKSINDTHGHLTGDEVIRRVAQVLKTEVRPADIVCRFGGEEFFVVLDDMPLGEATVLVDRLRRRIAAPAFARVPVTTSFGLTSLEFGGDSCHALIKQADDALYVSKETGRNRVTCYEELLGSQV